MTKELRNKLTERFEQLSNSVDCDEQVKDALLKAYLAGGECGYEIGIDEANDFMSKCIWGRCADKFHANDDKQKLKHSDEAVSKKGDNDE